MNQRIIVTGALGGAGSWIADRLRESYDVLALDKSLPDETDVEGISFHEVDLTDRGDTWETIADADASVVVHFGNIPSEANHAGGTVYENNTMANFAVLEAAGRAGARVVWASSETVYGTHWPDPRLPESLPVDEAHPVAPWNAYETSKLAGEAMAERVATAFDVPVATIRPSWIQYPGRYWVTELRDAFDPETATASGNFWSYIDVRDVVDIVEASMTAEFDGHEIFNAFAAENYLGIPTTTAIEAGYGELPPECSLTGDESAFSVQKARNILGWRPSHSWHDAEAEQRPDPSFSVRT